MREILFRGKTKSGMWVYGYYMLALIHGEKTLVIAPLTTHMCVTLDKERYIIDPETVGQYTGMTDRNGIKIFEGDIVSDSKLSNSLGIVKWQNKLAKFSLLSTQGNNAVYYLLSQKVIVVGNIYDSPELLEE